MPRALSATFRASLEDPNNPDPAIVFLTFEHDSFPGPMRFCWDVKDYVLAGDTYVGFPFALQFLSDTEDAPTARLMIQNVDRMIGLALKALVGSPTLTIEVYPASDFDLTVTPRVPLGTPALQYRASGLFLSDIEVDALSVQAAVRSWDYVQEPWPSVRATQSRLPALFR